MHSSGAVDVTLDLFWSFRSPYSYLAVPGAIRLERDFNVKVRFRPVLPLAVREPSFFSPDNLKRAKYIRVDFPRRAEMLGFPHAWPSPDPIVQDMTTYKISPDQPYNIYRLTWLGGFEIAHVGTEDGRPAEERLSFTMMPVGLRMRLRARS